MGENLDTGVARSARLPILIGGAVIATLLLTYYLYVRDQRTYFSSRNRRLLATLAEQLDGTLVSQQSFVRNYAHSRRAPIRFVKRIGHVEPVGTAPDTYLPNFDEGARDCLPVGAFALLSQTGGEVLSTRLSEAHGTTSLDINYSGAVPVTARIAPPTPVAGVAKFPQRDVDRHPTCRQNDQGLQFHEPSRPMVRRAWASVRFGKVLEPLFRQQLLSVFDDVMLARADGKVLYTFHQHHVTSGIDGREGEEGAGEVMLTNLASLTARTGWRSSGPLNMKRLRNETAQTDVALGGSDYILFTHPYAPSQSLENAEWIIAGLVSKRRFTKEVLSISASVIAVVLAVLILVISAWPFLRIALIGRHEALSVGDVLLLGVCILVQTSILTLVLLDVVAYQRLRTASAQQMKSFGEQLERDLQTDIDRAQAALYAFKDWSRVANTWSTEVLGDQKTNLSFVRNVITVNPYIETATWIDPTGRQHYKVTMAKGSPLLDVSTRQYFRDARLQKYLPLRDVSFQSLRSLTTGAPEVVVATTSGLDHLPVVAATVNLVHITHSVLPPGYRFAIINEDGQVLLHSEPQRNGYENFFAETDHDRTIRSAVFARTELFDTVRYWGEDHTAYVHPLQDVPWTLVVLRSKELLRTANTDSLAMTLVLLLTHSMAFVFLLVAVLLWNPRYRAPGVWPHDSKQGEYWRLIEVYVATIVAAVASFYALDPLSVLMIAAVSATQALAATHLLLNDRARQRMSWPIALTVWLMATGVWAYAILTGHAMPGTGVQNWTWTVRIVMLLLLAANGVLTLRPAPVTRPRLSLLRRYVTAAVLLLVIAAVLPTAGFFKVANRIEIEGLVKYTQLVIAERAEKAISAMEELNAGDESVENYDVDLPDDSTRTRWRLASATVGPRACKQRESRMPDLVQRLLPAYSEQTVLLRLIHSQSGENARWTWCRDGNYLELEKKISLPAVSRDGTASGPLHKIRQHAPPLALFVTSRIPLSFAGLTELPRDRGAQLRYIAGAIAFLLAVAAFAAFLWWVVTFIARKVFLIDVSEPLWLKPPPPLKPSLGDHVFLVYGETDIDKLTKPRAMNEGALPGFGDFHDVDFAMVGKDRSWHAALEEIDRSPRGQNVRILAFENQLSSSSVTLEKLAFLEKLLALPDRMVIMASRVTPAYVLATMREPERTRWCALLEKFVWVTEEQLDLAAADPPKDPPTPHLRWLWEECRHTKFLRAVYAELKDHGGERDRVKDELRERCGAYYGSLWASCSEDEKRLLYQLAHDGLLNGKDRRNVRHLMARGLIRRDPNLKVFNETFRLYVLSAARRESLHVPAQTGPTAWDNIRVPIFVVLVTVVLLIFTTQKDLLNLTSGLAAALATGLPAIVKLFGVLTERRIAAGEPR